MERMVLTADVRAKLAAYRIANAAEDAAWKAQESERKSGALDMRAMSEAWTKARNVLRDATNSLAIALDLDEVVAGSRERCEHDDETIERYFPGSTCVACSDSLSVPAFLSVPSAER